MSPASIARAQCDAVLIGSIDEDTSPAADPEVGDGVVSPEAPSRAEAGSMQRPTPQPTPRPTLHPMPRPKRTIPAALRRKVKRRDHGKCQSPGCRSSRNCDLHHIKPWSEGGEHSLDNLITLCESHHLALHEGALSVRWTDGRFVFESEGRNSFTRATRAVETALALKGLGWKPHEIKTAVERTRTHVGTADLPLQDWIKIALRYCPSPLTG